MTKQEFLDVTYAASAAGEFRANKTLVRYRDPATGEADCIGRLIPAADYVESMEKYSADRLASDFRAFRTLLNLPRDEYGDYVKPELHLQPYDLLEIQRVYDAHARKASWHHDGFMHDLLKLDCMAGVQLLCDYCI